MKVKDIRDGTATCGGKLGDSGRCLFCIVYVAPWQWQVPLLCASILVVSSKPLQIAQREWGVCLMCVFAMIVVAVVCLYIAMLLCKMQNPKTEKESKK